MKKNEERKKSTLRKGVRRSAQVTVNLSDFLQNDSAISLNSIFRPKNSLIGSLDDIILLTLSSRNLASFTALEVTKKET
jgi:hypothetical protein